MRALKLILAVILLALLALFGSVAWLGASQSGTRFLITQLLALSPVPIEVEGVQGSLVGGLAATGVAIELPVALISVTDVSVAWRPADLVAGRIALTNVDIDTLTVDLVEVTETSDSDRDLLFWLQLPVDVRVQRGHVDNLRIVAAEFEQVDLVAALGWGRLIVREAAARIAGIDLQLAGKLSGSAPGDLDAELQWQWPALGYSGGGSFAGDIDVLNFSHRVQLPDTVDLTGTITSLFYKPQLTGFASWDAVTIPGGQPLFIKAGEANIGSDFTSARVAARGSLLFAEFPAMPAQLDGVVRLDGVTIDSYQLDAFDGRVKGDGELSFVNGVSGSLDVVASDIALGYLFPEYPGHVDFDSRLEFRTATDIDIAIARFDGELYGKSLGGHANVAIRDGEVAAVDGDIALAQNRLTANLKLLPALSGTARVNVTELADIWPEASGAVDAKISIAGSFDKPRIDISGQAAGLDYENLSVADVAADFRYAHGKETSGSLVAAGLIYAGNDLGELRASVAGQPANHTTQWRLTGGSVYADVETSGGWDGAVLKQRLTNAQIQPRDFAAWDLTGQPELTVSTEAAQLEGHCWAQDTASLCFGESTASEELTTTSFSLQRFPLLALSSFLPTDVRVTGLADAEGALRLEGGRLRGRFGWQQGETVLAYQLDDEILETRISELKLSVDADEEVATLAASALGPDGLKLRAAGSVALPVNDGSVLSGELAGVLPDISLFRPLILRVADTGEMKGAARINLRLAGRVGDPVFSGGAFIENGLLQLPAAGTTLSDINISATSAGGDKLVLAGNLRAGAGTARISGDIVLTETGGLVADLVLAGENLATVQQPQLNLLSSPQLQVRVDDKGVDVSGRVVIPEATARIRELPPEAVKRSADVVIHGDDESLEYETNEKVVTGDIEVVLGDKVQFYGFGLESRLDGSLRLTQRPGRTLRGNGTVRVRDGFLTGYGKELRVDRGTLTFTGPLDDPVVDVQVSRDTTYENRRYTVGLRLSGTASNLKTEPFSRPAMSEQDILAFLLLDRPASGSGEDTGVSGALLAMGLGQMLPGDGGKLGLDEISFEGSEFNQTAVVAGKRISDDIYIRYVFGLFGQPGQFRIRYRLGRGFSLEATTGGTSQALDLIYLIERD